APAASAADAVMAVEAAAEAFKTWSQTGPGERRALLLKAADKLEAKTPQFIEAVSAEPGATGMWGGVNVFLAAGMLREAAALTTQIAGEIERVMALGAIGLGQCFQLGCIERRLGSGLGGGQPGRDAEGCAGRQCTAAGRQWRGSSSLEGRAVRNGAWQAGVFHAVCILGLPRKARGSTVIVMSDEGKNRK
ncbi:MAG: aldehyde dehydrogenase family protein, partial [Pseudohongiellaceae bacterium]